MLLIRVQRRLASEIRHRVLTTESRQARNDTGERGLRQTHDKVIRGRRRRQNADRRRRALRVPERICLQEAAEIGAHGGEHSNARCEAWLRRLSLSSADHNIYGKWYSTRSSLENVLSIWRRYVQRVLRAAADHDSGGNFKNREMLLLRQRAQPS